MQRLLLAMVVFGVLTAGCTEPTALGPSATQTASSPTRDCNEDGVVCRDGPAILHGLVVDAAFLPVANATIKVAQTNQTGTTDAAGGFSFEVPVAQVYTVSAAATGYVNQTLFSSPNLSRMIFTMRVDRAVLAPYTQLQEFKGHLDCGAEIPIASGSCTLFLDTVTGSNPVVTNASRFQFNIEPAWATIVLDLVFDGQESFDGLRMSVRGLGAANQLNEYEQYARFHNSTSYTARLEPGQTYQDGVAPVPGNATAFQVEVYPQGHGWHKACAPPGSDTCFLGVGAGVNIEFQLIVTTFYGAAAPAGYTVQA